jgi:hypothetical protein
MEAKLWKDMTPEEKGALLLAHHEGKEIEFFASHNAWQGCEGSPSWISYYAYRVKPVPVREPWKYQHAGNGRWYYPTGEGYWAPIAGQGMGLYPRKLNEDYLIGYKKQGPFKKEDTLKITLHFVDGVAQADASVEVL